MVEKSNNFIVLIILESKTWNHKLWDKNIGIKLLGSDTDDDSMDLIPKGKVTKARIKKWGYIKLKSFYTANKSLTKRKDNLPHGKKSCIC